MKPNTVKVPEIQDWPYIEIARANAEFKLLFGKEPAVLLVGVYLWTNLQAAVPGSLGFFAYSGIPVKLDRSGILGGRDFIFSR